MMSDIIENISSVQAAIAAEMNVEQIVEMANRSAEIIRDLEKENQQLKEELGNRKNELKNLCVAHVDLIDIEQETDRENQQLKEELKKSLEGKRKR